MAYIKNTWVDQQVERPRTYQFNSNPDGSTTLIDDFGQVTEIGTPVNADNLNHIEDGIVNSATVDLDNLSETGEEKFNTKANKTELDGNWVKTNISICSNVTFASNPSEKQYDISQYLPNDDNVYEIVLSILFKVGSTVGNNALYNCGSDLIDAIRLAFQVNSVRNIQFYGAGNCIIPIKNREIILRQANTDNGNSTVVRFDLVGYRKVK